MIDREKDKRGGTLIKLLMTYPFEKNKENFFELDRKRNVCIYIYIYIYIYQGRMNQIVHIKLYWIYCPEMAIDKERR